MATIPAQIANDEPEAASLRGNVPALLALCLGQFSIVLAFQGTAIALPAIEEAFTLSVATTQWLVSINALVFGALLLPAGRAADIFGHRRVFLLGAALFALGSLGAGLAPEVGTMIGARALQGAGAALFAPAAFALLVDTFRGETVQRRALAIWTAAGPFGGIAAVLTGGALATLIGWRSVFLVGMPVMIVAMLLAWRRVHSGMAQLRARIDWMGVVLGGGGIGLIVYGLSLVPSASGASGPVIGGLMVGGLLLAAFIRHERRTAEPLTPRSIFARVEMNRAYLAAFAHGASTNTWAVFYSLYMQQIRDASAWQTGLGMVPCNLAIIGGTALGARFNGRGAFRLAMSLGMVLAAAGLFALTVVAEGGAPLPPLIPGLSLIGFGLGMAQVGIFGSAMVELDAEARGVVGGMINTAAQIGTAVGLALLVIVSERVSGEIAQVRLAFVTAGVFGLLGGIAVMLVRGHSATTVEMRRYWA